MDLLTYLLQFLCCLSFCVYLLIDTIWFTVNTRLLPYAHSNSQPLSLRLNCSLVSMLRRSCGSLFQIVGPHTRKLRQSNRVDRCCWQSNFRTTRCWRNNQIRIGPDVLIKRINTLRSFRVVITYALYTSNFIGTFYVSVSIRLYAYLCHRHRQ